MRLSLQFKYFYQIGNCLVVINYKDSGVYIGLTSFRTCFLVVMNGFEGHNIQMDTVRSLHIYFLTDSVFTKFIKDLMDTQ